MGKALTPQERNEIFNSIAKRKWSIGELAKMHKCSASTIMRYMEMDGKYISCKESIDKKPKPLQEPPKFMNSYPIPALTGVTLITYNEIRALNDEILRLQEKRNEWLVGVHNAVDILFGIPAS